MVHQAYSGCPISRSVICEMILMQYFFSNIKKLRKTDSLCIFLKLYNLIRLCCRSVRRSSPGHAKLLARWDASIRAGSSYGSPLPGRPSHGHEAACHVSSRTLLKQQSSHHIRFEVHTFLSSLCFLKRAAAKQQSDLVVVKSNIIC